MGCSPYRFAAPVASLPRRSPGCLQWHACNHGQVLLKISMSNGDSSCAQKVIGPPHFQNGEHHTTFTPDTFYTKHLLHQIQSFVLRHDASLGHWYAGVDTRSSSQAPYFWAKKPVEPAACGIWATWLESSSVHAACSYTKAEVASTAPTSCPLTKAVHSMSHS